MQAIMWSTNLEHHQRVNVVVVVVAVVVHVGVGGPVESFRHIGGGLNLQEEKSSSRSSYEENLSLLDQLNWMSC